MIEYLFTIHLDSPIDTMPYPTEYVQAIGDTITVDDAGNLHIKKNNGRNLVFMCATYRWVYVKVTERVCELPDAAEYEKAKKEEIRKNEAEFAKGKQTKIIPGTSYGTECISGSGGCELPVD